MAYVYKYTWKCFKGIKYILDINVNGLPDDIKLNCLFLTSLRFLNYIQFELLIWEIKYLYQECFLIFIFINDI